MSASFTELPKDLPVPADDGAAAHLPGSVVPEIELPATDGSRISLGGFTGRIVLYVYPMTGRPGVALPDGWDAIPGARGCTPQSCAFRDHFQELTTLGASVFGLSAQSSEYQREARERLHLPFELLSDQTLQLKTQLRLPTFRTDGLELYKRLTLILDIRDVVKVFYPVFPPDKNATEVVAWLSAQQRADPQRL